MADDKMSDKGDEKMSDKGDEKMSDKGDEKMSDKGGPNYVAEDVFRQVSGLGGFLFVAFVTPMAPNNSGHTGVRRGTSARGSALTLVGSEALERDNEASEIQRQSANQDRELVKQLADWIRAQSGQPARKAKPARLRAIQSAKKSQRWSLKTGA
jgi:hypothetical protein